jgi:serine/threonine-protein kinase
MNAEEIFHDALARPQAERPAFLAAACAGDEPLQQRLQALLDAHENPGSFLAVQPPSPVATIDEPVLERPGTIIGPYKLLEQIGEGGFGVVFMAEQTQPVRRKVALKILKPGMDTRQVVARFEAERQALAIMDHPNIAKVHDGGATPSGRPYFVMELVKGAPITEFCDQNQLTPRQRLELFIPVCQAVQHAHQKGIIHRDLKPSNVLVSRHDTTPLVKVIDFGVAKALGQELTDKTLFTGVAQMVGTPLYMSPEQAGMSDLDVDTRSDIYSLGVLLYELLTGTTPFTKERFKQAAYDEIRRIIREEEPPRPSTRLSECKDTLPSISAQRQTEPAKLTRLVRGELDWIVMKALEKDRNRRYETANTFALDIHRYLYDEPVLACPPSSSYRFRKFARRNKTGLAVAGLVLFFLVLLGGGVGWVVRESVARQSQAVNDLELALERAELFLEQGNRAEALAALDRAELLRGQAPADPERDERLAALARDLKLITQFEKIRLRVQSGVDENRSSFTLEAAFPDIREALRRYGIEIGVTAPAEVAALIQGRPEVVRRDLLAALDQCVLPAPMGDAATRQWLQATLTAADNDPWRVRARKAAIARDWKMLEQLARKADAHKQPPGFLLFVAYVLRPPMRGTRLELLRRVQRAHPADLWANIQLAEELKATRQPAEAVRYHTAALALRPNNPGVLLNRGIALEAAGEVDAAIADYRQAVALAPRYAAAHTSLGNALYAKGKRDEAIAEYRAAIRSNKDFALARNNLGIALYAKGKRDEAIAEYRAAIGNNNDYALAALAHNNLGVALDAKGKRDEAIAEYRAAIRSNNDFAEPHYNLGNALDAKGKRDEAIAEYRAAIRLKKDYPEAHNNLGNALYAKGKRDEAIAEYRAAIRSNKDYAEAHWNLGRTLLLQGEFGKALEALRRGHELGSKRPGWPAFHAQWVRHCERWVELDRELPDFLKGKKTPASAAERIELAGLCSLKRLHHAATRFYKEALAAQPSLMDDLSAAHRYNAACAAALAGCGQGKDAAKPDSQERARLLHRALDWLQADLKAWGRLLDKGPNRAHSAARVASVLQHWLVDPDLAGVRGPETLAKLPDAERQPWRKLWADVAATLARARQTATPEKKPAAR